MAQDEEPAGELYDFLYRDTNRLISYYAQIFQGRLTGFEELESIREAKDRDVKGDAKLASISVKKTEDSQTSNKKTFDPHDLNTTDVLTYLSDNGYVFDDFDEAPNGGLFLAEGKIFFLDPQLIKTTSSMFSLMVGQGVIDVEDPNVITGVQALNTLLEGVPFPPIYFLETEDGQIITGVAKESGMEEIVTTYYFRFGQNALPGVKLLALKEASEALAPSSVSDFIKGSQALTGMLSMLFFPADAIRATPLVLFRNFKPISSNK